MNSSKFASDATNENSSKLNSNTITNSKMFFIRNTQTSLWLMLLQSQLRSLLRYHYVDNRDGTTGGASTSGIGSAGPSSSTPNAFAFGSVAFRQASRSSAISAAFHPEASQRCGAAPVVLIDIAIAGVAPNN
jgi:hypothetical protein